MIRKYIYNYVWDDSEDEGHIWGNLKHCPDDRYVAPEEAEEIQKATIERLKEIIIDDMKERFADYLEYRDIIRTEIEAKPQRYGEIIEFTLFFVEDMGEYGEFNNTIFITLFWLY